MSVSRLHCSADNLFVQVTDANNLTSSRIGVTISMMAKCDRVNLIRYHMFAKYGYQSVRSFCYFDSVGVDTGKYTVRITFEGAHRSVRGNAKQVSEETPPVSSDGRR